MTFILQGSPLRLKCPFWGRPGQARTSRVTDIIQKNKSKRLNPLAVVCSKVIPWPGHRIKEAALPSFWVSEK